MEHVRWSSVPTLERPIVVCAFEGWNDAGDAATTAARWLRAEWGLEPFGEIDPEEFYDFTTLRPQVRLDDDGNRVIDWPVTELAAGRVPGTQTDVIVIVGHEPHLRWRTYCHEVVGLAVELDARMVLVLGALLAEVPHTRPVSVVGSAYDPGLVEQLDLRRSNYEGPTGIVGVLHAELASAGLASASLWASVPTYVPGATSPKAALALVGRAAALLAVPVTTTELEIASASYERQVSEVVEDDEEMRSYVAELEEHYVEDDVPSARSLVDEVERFLRDQSAD